MAIDLTRPPGTSLTVRPEPATEKPYEYKTGKKVSASGGEGMFGEDGFTFGDLIDIINPLQHIPIVSTLYRAITGDEISPAARFAGGGIFGGLVGVAMAAVNEIAESATGKDIGDNVMAAIMPTESGAGPAAGKATASASLPITTSAADGAAEFSEFSVDALGAATSSAEMTEGANIWGTLATDHYKQAQLLAGVQDNMLKVAIPGARKDELDEPKGDEPYTDWLSRVAPQT